jgi:sugar-specific transcriptional regulator TrmB
MRPEEVFGVNAGKVWNALKAKGMLTASQISKETGLKLTEVFGALGWLGREGKIEIIEEKKKILYKLTE